MNTQEVEQQFHQAAANKEYAKALSVATQYFDLFPYHAQRVVYFWRMEMACRIEHYLCRNRSEARSGEFLI